MVNYMHGYKILHGGDINENGKLKEDTLLNLSFGSKDECNRPREAAILRVKDQLFPCLWDTYDLITVELPAEIQEIWEAGEPGVGAVDSLTSGARPDRLADKQRCYWQVSHVSRVRSQRTLREAVCRALGIDSNLRDLMPRQFFGSSDVLCV